MNRKRLAAFVLLALLILGGVAGCVWYFRPASEQLSLPGVVEIQEVRLGSKIGGRVAEVKVREGDLVEAGQLLVRFDMPEMEAQRKQLAAQVLAAEAQLEKAKNGPRIQEKDAARASWEAAQARYEMMQAGFRAEEKRQAEAELENAEADLKLFREEYDRADRLFRQGSMAKADFDIARAARERGVARVANARAKFELMKAGYRAEETKAALAEAKRAEANYKLLEAGTRSEEIDEAAAKVEEVKARLREVEAHLEEGQVRAPERAVIEVLAVRKGDLVPPQQPVVRILRADDLWVRAYVPETLLGKVRLNQPVEVTVDSYPGRVFHGTVIQVASESEFTPRNVQSVDERRHQVFGIKVQVPDPQGVFKSGMAAEVKLKLHE